MNKPSKPKPPKLRVGLVVDTSIDLNDGVQQYVRTLGKALEKRGHHVEIVTGHSTQKQFEGLPIVSLSRNITLRFNANRVNIPLPITKNKAKRFWRAHNFDILHVQAPYSPFLAGKLMLEAPEQVAQVATFHILPVSFWQSLGSRLLNLFYYKSKRRLNRVISVSPPAAEFCQKIFRLRSEVVPNMVNLPNFKTKKLNNAVSKEGTIIFLGRLVKRKGASQLLQAFKELENKSSNYSLVIAGDGPERKKLTRLATELGLVNVSFLGEVSELRKWELLADADVACFPSLYGESFGIVLLEAMASKRPIVLAGDNPGYRSVLQASPTQLINPSYKKQFASRLEDLLTKPEIRNRLLNWQVKQLQYYSADNVSQRIESVYFDAIAKQAKNGHNKTKA